MAFKVTGTHLKNIKKAAILQKVNFLTQYLVASNSSLITLEK